MTVTLLKAKWVLLSVTCTVIKSFISLVFHAAKAKSTLKQNVYCALPMILDSLVTIYTQRDVSLCWKSDHRNSTWWHYVTSLVSFFWLWISNLLHTKFRSTQMSCIWMYSMASTCEWENVALMKVARLTDYLSLDQFSTLPLRESVVPFLNVILFWLHLVKNHSGCLMVYEAATGFVCKWHHQYRLSVGFQRNLLEFINSQITTMIYVLNWIKWFKQALPAVKFAAIKGVLLDSLLRIHLYVIFFLCPCLHADKLLVDKTMNIMTGLFTPS